MVALTSTHQKMSGEIYKVSETTENERVCITQYEQKEYDSCTWENEDFGKKLNSNLQMLWFQCEMLEFKDRL